MSSNREIWKRKLEDAYNMITSQAQINQWASDAQIKQWVNSFEVVKMVDDYRWFWKPENVKIVLLAESHVYTTEEDMRMELNYKKIPERYKKMFTEDDVPGKYVRFVYCLGYGENELLKNRVNCNRGSPDFWKIFYSCCNDISSDSDFAPILKGKTKKFDERLENKIRLLKDLRKKGIWLVDASIVGLYRCNDRISQTTKKNIIKSCWGSYTKPLIESLEPECIICIGRGVKKILSNELENLKLRRLEVIPQPQNRHRSNNYLYYLEKIRSICKQIVGD